MMKQLITGIKTCLVIMVFLSIPGHLSAQNSSLVGRIIESTTGKPLENAVVSIPDFGSTTSDDLGMYSFKNLSAGEYTVIAGMRGYQSSEAGIHVEPGFHRINDINLVKTIQDGDRILVIDRKRQLNQSLNNQRESIQFSKILNTRQLDAFGDETVEKAISRLPGVHIGRNGGANIRGTGYGHYNILMDGQPVASMGFGSRSVDLSGFSADMIRKLEVIKVATPDMPADGLGGSVNLHTLAPVGERAIEVYGGAGLHPAYFKYGGVGSRAGMHYSEAVREDLSVGANLKYQQGHYAWESLQIGYDAADFGNGFTDVIGRVSPGLHANQQNMHSGGVQLHYVPSDRVVIHLDGLYNNDNRVIEQHRNYWDSGGDWISPDTTGLEGGLGSYGYNAGRTDHNVHHYRIHTGVRHYLNRFDLEYGLNWSSSNANRNSYLFPFERSGLNLSINHLDHTRPAMYPPEGILLNDGTIDYRTLRFQELEYTVDDHRSRLLTGYVDAEIPFKNFSIKSGAGFHINNNQGDFSYTLHSYNRSLDLYRFRMIREGQINILDEDDYFIPWLINTSLARDFFEGSVPQFEKDENQVRRDSDIWNYDHSERIYSGYGMGTFQLANLQMIGGLRIELYEADYEGMDVEFNESGELMAAGTNLENQQILHLFPHAQMAYTPVDGMKMRAAWSQTIQRPDYRILSPFHLTTKQDFIIFRGNPKLEPMVSENYDLFFDYYYHKSGHLGINLFYKRLSNLFYESTNELMSGEFTGFNEYTFENSDEKASISGVEVSWMQDLPFLPGILGNLGTYVNYTWSQSDYSADIRPEEHMVFPGHSPHIVNAALHFTRGRIFSQVSYHWRSETMVRLGRSLQYAPSINQNNPVYLDRYESGVGSLSASFEFRISEEFRFWADAFNLIPAKRVAYDYSRSLYPAETDLYKGIVFRSGVRYNL